MKQFKLAVVGATGLVGETMIRVLEERKFPIDTLVPLASSDSRGKTVKFCGKNVPVQVLSRTSFKNVDFALFSAGGDISLEFAPIAKSSGAVVIDNTSAFRMEPNIPLVVPEVNKDILASVISSMKSGKGAIIANPNCSTIQLVCVLKPIHDAAKIKRVVVSTYQSVSGAGREALEDLENQTQYVFPHPIAFNCIPQIDKFETNGYTKEEMKVVRETKKIMGDEEIAVTCTAVRVPVKVGHSEAVNIETKKKFFIEDIRKLLSKAPGVIVIDEPSQAKYPLAVNIAGRDEVFVGRIRSDQSCSNGIDLWIVADNLRKGAAVNAVQIAELLI